MTTNKHLPDAITRFKPRFETCLESLFAFVAASQQSNENSQLLDAMRYSTLQGGKRLRAMLVYLTASCCGQQIEPQVDKPGSIGAAPTLHPVDVAAIAVELIHCYSLIHDDLPSMDNDALRRGKPTCHIAFDEATAILAGDALQALAFNTLATQGTMHADVRIRLLHSLTTASGLTGMVGGQAIDLASENKTISLAQLQRMHRLKTGALIESSVAMGAICANAGVAETTALQQYARAIGLAFQIQDDILDIAGDPSLMGKTQGADSAANKSTFPALLGMKEAEAHSNQLIDEALAAIDIFSTQSEPLRQLAHFFIHRAA